jgi:hypothetical protein
VKCGYHLQYQQPILLVLFLALRCITVHWLFVVELFVFSGSVAVMVPPVDPLSVQLFVNTGHLSRCNSNMAACALHTDNAV